MSYPANSLICNGIASGQSNRYIVPPQTIQSAISDHQYKPNQIDWAPRSNELVQAQSEFDAAVAAYSIGQIGEAELNAVLKRVNDAVWDLSRRGADYRARKEAGQTKHGDYFKEFYGCTDEEAQQRLRQGIRQMDIQRANEERNGSRILQQSRHGRNQ